MKRFMLILALMLPMVATWAQKWTPKDNHQYDAETVIKVKVNVNGAEVGTAPSAMISQLAAFIGDECRAAETSPTISDNEDGIENIYVLRVAGSTGSVLSSDMGKDINFKVFTDDDGAVYNFTTKSTFNGDGDGDAELIVLNLDKITDVQMPPEIEVRKKASEFPCDVELEGHTIYKYGEDGYVPMGESSLDAHFEWIGATVNGAANSYITGTTVTVVEEDAFDDNYFDVSMNGHFVDSEGNQVGMDYNLTVGIRIKIANTPVSSITCDLTTIDKFYTNESLHSYLASHVTILPAEAQQAFHLTVPSERGGVNGFDVPQEGGQYTVSIVPDDEDYTGEPAQVIVKVYVRPRSISLTKSEMEFHVGDDVKKALNDNIVYTWPGDGSHPGQWAETTLEYSFDGTYVSSEGKAIQMTNGSRATATATLTYGLTVYPGDAHRPSVNMTVVISSALSLTARVNEINFQRNVDAEKSPVLVEVNNPYSEPFDYNDLAMTFIASPSPAQVESIYEVSKVGTVTTYGFKIKPQMVSQRAAYQVKWGEELLTPMGAGEASSPWYITISAVQNLAKGWNWVSFNTLAAGTPALEEVFTVADINEARTQDLIVFNDAKRGLMGDLKNVDPTQGMMKVYANKATTLNLGYVNVFANYRLDYMALKGFNWVNNPYEFDIPAEDIADYFMLSGVADGDMMLTRNGFATYSESSSKWIASDGFVLGCGQGIIYYTKADRNSLSFNSAAVAPVKRSASAAKARFAPVFTYDVSAYADNMAMIANVQGLQNPEDYSVGVFAGEECRGCGRYVEEAGAMLINAAGNRNEKLTLRLYNHQTGEMFDISETVNCTAIQGSLQAPVQLNAPVATGISNVSPSQMGNGKTYDLSGRQVQQAQKGLYIIDGKKVIK